MTDYDVEFWCYRCDDFVVIDVLENPRDFNPFEYFDDDRTLPCGHQFDAATETRGEPEETTLRKKIARRKKEFDASEHPGEQQYLERQIRKLLAELRDVESSGGEQQ